MKLKDGVFACVLVIENNKPATLNHDLLLKNEIIDESLELSLPSVQVTNFGSTLKYNTKNFTDIDIISQNNRIDIYDYKSLNREKVIEIGIKYIKKIKPKITALGLNFGKIIEVNPSKKEELLFFENNMFNKNFFSFLKNEIAIDRFSYNFKVDYINYLLNISIDTINPIQGDEGILFQSNFHFDLNPTNTNMKKNVLEILDNWQEFKTINDDFYKKMLSNLGGEYDIN